MKHGKYKHGKHKGHKFKGHKYKGYKGKGFKKMGKKMKKMFKERIESSADYANTDGVTPVLLAVENGLLNLIKLLLKAAPQSLRAVSKDGANVLAIAAQAGQVEVVDMLLTCKVPVDLKCGKGRTPLMFAAASGGPDFTESRPVTHGARTNPSEFPEVAPLAAAAQNGHVEVIQVLLQNSADVDAHDGDWDSALHEAVYSGQVEAARTLVEASLGANVNKRNRSGWTPLMGAAHRNFVVIMELLVWKGASLMLKTKDGRTALHIAAEEGHTEATRFLLGRGASVDAVDRLKRTPLMLAAYRGHKDTVQLLLDNDASLARTDYMNQNPLEVALSNSKIDVATLLVYSEPWFRNKRKQTSNSSSPRVKRQHAAHVSP
ncbi:hypothetical protein PF011_g16430 [Phytophthora fragariae]|uniref:Uncharacterized protein n=1 Tax=Phytophthora fragariae TaxID=53985 RepID=A0A6A3JJ86_9STRA|nr:hypothetical protein PF011_g16430 [Phytophthora fragariae]